MNRLYLKWISIFCYLVLAACSASHDYIDGSSVGGYVFNDDFDQVLADNANNIIVTKCLNCHGPGSSSGHLNFEQLINDGFITAGPPNVSILYRCINNSVCITREGYQTDNMAERAELNELEIQTLNDFIDDLFIDPPQ